MMSQESLLEHTSYTDAFYTFLVFKFVPNTVYILKNNISEQIKQKHSDTF